MQDLWKTVSKYPTLLIGSFLSILLGLLEPVLPLLKRPVTAVAIVGLFLGGFAFLYFTLKAMLGLNVA